MLSETSVKDMTITASRLCKLVQDEKVNFNCSVQRGYVWKPEQNSGLIHSLIYNYPVPPLFFAEQGHDEFDGLDGKQRSHAIKSYIENSYALSDNFEAITGEDGEDYDFSGMKFSQLPDWAQDKIKNYPLVVHSFSGLSEDQYVTLFYKLNQGSKFTPIELTRVRTKCLEKFQEIAKHDIVQMAVSEKGRVKYNHENLVMQVWALCFAYDDKFSLESKALGKIVENAEVTDEQMSTIDFVFNIINNMVYECNEREDVHKKYKKIAKRLTTRTHLVTLTRVVMLALEKDYEVDDMLEWSRVFFYGDKNTTTVSAPYNNACGAGTNKRDKVDTRLREMSGHLDAFVAERERRRQ